jgi:NTE family protein
LGSGGAKGLAHLGVLYELKQAGIVPDLIVGCSAGAIAGAMYASHDDLAPLINDLLKSTRDDVIAMDLSAYSIYSTNKFMSFLRTHINAQTFAELKIPLIVVATNLEFGNLTPFSVGPLLPAVMASAAVPGVFYPVKIDGDYFIDGGVASPVPVFIAKQFQPNIIIAVNISENLPKTSPTNIAGLLRRSLEISYKQHAHLDTKFADLVIDFDFNNIGAFSDQQNEFLYNAGRQAAKKALPQIKARLAKK